MRVTTGAAEVCRDENHQSSFPEKVAVELQATESVGVYDTLCAWNLKRFEGDAIDWLIS